MKKILLAERKKAFNKALKQKYLSCIFDIDGTLTDLAEEPIHDFIAKTLASISTHSPIAICTGRKLEHVFPKINPLFARAKKMDNLENVRSKVVLLCENGNVGYFYDKDSGKYVEFYRTRYPYSESHKKSLFKAINDGLKNQISGSFMNETSMVFQPLNVNDANKPAVEKRARILVKAIEKILIDHDKKNLLKIADSGIGTIIFPYDGDKRAGVYQFGEFMRKKWGYDISEELTEFALFGDKPGTYGNDETFLDGTFGTPFTVGEIVDHKILPIPVFAPAIRAKRTAGGETASARARRSKAETIKNADILKGPLGTFSLLQRLKFG